MDVVGVSVDMIAKSVEISTVGQHQLGFIDVYCGYIHSFMSLEANKHN